MDLPEIKTTILGCQASPLLAYSATLCLHEKCIGGANISIRDSRKLSLVFLGKGMFPAIHRDSIFREKGLVLSNVQCLQFN